MLRIITFLLFMLAVINNSMILCTRLMKTKYIAYHFFSCLIAGGITKQIREVVEPFNTFAGICLS